METNSFIHVGLPPPPPHGQPATTAKPTVAFTTPSNYAERLSSILTLKGFNPLWLPTITTHSTPLTRSSLRPYLRPPPNSAPNHPPPINDFSVLAFTSRAGISAFRDAVEELDRRPLLRDGGEFVIAALGYDSVLLDDAFVDLVCENVGRVRIAVPEVATPSGLVAELGLGRGRKVLCPVPLVVGMEEPPVVPGFLKELEKTGWVAVISSSPPPPVSSHSQPQPTASHTHPPSPRLIPPPEERNRALTLRLVMSLAGG